MSDEASPQLPADGHDQRPIPSNDQNERRGVASESQAVPVPIPQNYKQAGYFMSLIEREGDAAMYADASRTYFEVHKVRVRPAERIVTRHYPVREILAGNEEFGTFAWACVNLERAQVRFANIVAESKS